MDSKKLIALEESVIMQSYGRAPIVLEKGKGCWLWGSDGKKYLDLVGALATCSIGYANKEHAEAICAQAKKLVNTTNLYFTEPQILLAAKLQQLSGMGKSFFSNSGSEAVEVALKLARKATGKKGVIATERAFHGRTMAALAATWKENYKDYCAPHVPGFKHVPFNDVDALEKAVDESTAAFIVEPIQGESGIIVPEKGYLKKVREICSRKGILLIVDEVQTGTARTGKFFAFEHEGIKPDIAALAKGIGNGVSIGVTIAEQGIDFGKGQQGSTFGGNPLACSAALATIEFIEKNKLAGNAEKMGAYAVEKLEKMKKEISAIKEVRGKGLMIGIELHGDAKKIVEKCREKGVLVNAATDSTVRLLPPLIISKEEIDFGLKVIGGALKELK
ncbi:MAG: aspartate aminotransferase family protein [Candidatus Diapherotrites archaeon]